MFEHENVPNTSISRMEPVHPETTFERTYYDNGQIKCERPFVDSAVTGIVRFWYENGAVWKELPQIEGVFHGLMRVWDPEGRLVGECKFERGAGLSRSFYPNGQLKSEIYVRDNTFPHGPLRVWSLTGQLVGEQFFTRRGRVSKKRYIEECKSDPTLPPCDSTNAPVPLLDQPQKPALHHLVSLGEYPDARDALEWLKGAAEGAERRLGELPSAEDSIELVNEFLSAGAKRVLAVNVHEDDDGSQDSGELVVELPSRRATKKRRKVLDACNEQNQSLGFAPIEDSGQKYVHIALD